MKHKSDGGIEIAIIGLLIACAVVFLAGCASTGLSHQERIDTVLQMGCPHGTTMHVERGVGRRITDAYCVYD